MKRSKSIFISKERLTFTKIFYGLFILLGVLATFLGRENIIFAQCGGFDNGGGARCFDGINGYDLCVANPEVFYETPQHVAYETPQQLACERKLETELKDINNPDSPNYDSDLEEYGGRDIEFAYDQPYPSVHTDKIPADGALDKDFKLQIGIGKGCVLPSKSSIRKALVKNYEAYESALGSSDDPSLGSKAPDAPLPAGLSTN